MNPFKEKAKPIESCIVDWKTLASRPYDKTAVDPYTRLRIILMNGTEFESVWMGHQFSRHCADNDLRRELALIRRVEQQQQKRIAALKPADETILEHTIGYEMLAVDLTSALARQESNAEVKAALDFALLEDFDHLYRYADLLEGERGIDPEALVGSHVEIMPGRPTISEYRHPYDDIRRPVRAGDSLLTKLNVNIITAAEQQTMNYYMNIGGFYDTDAGRQLYSEIALIEEQHVSHYGSLKDPHCTWLESLLMHEYTECYLYWSAFESEKDRRIRHLWEELFEQEVAHLHKAKELLQTHEGKDWQQVIPDGEFPPLLVLQPSKEYVRAVLESARLTSRREDYCDVADLPDDADFFRYQQQVNHNVNAVRSHTVIQAYIDEHGTDWRSQDAPHPIPALDDRTADNTRVGRCKKEAARR
ncbi:MAG: hypothetical protein ACI4OL_00265 [Gemmiger sp.]